MHLPEQPKASSWTPTLKTTGSEVSASDPATLYQVLPYQTLHLLCRLYGTFLDKKAKVAVDAPIKTSEHRNTLFLFGIDQEGIAEIFRDLRDIDHLPARSDCHEHPAVVHGIVNMPVIGGRLPEHHDIVTD